MTVGRCVEEALWLFVSMERTCQAQLLAEAAGTPVLIDADVAAETAAYLNHPYSGWFSPQPMFDQIMRDQPDLRE